MVYYGNIPLKRLLVTDVGFKIKVLLSLPLQLLSDYSSII